MSNIHWSRKFEDVWGNVPDVPCPFVEYLEIGRALRCAIEITMKDLVSLISDMIGFEGEIVWDRTKPDGRPRRMLDVSHAERLFGFKAPTSLKVGLRSTIDWHLANKGGR